MESSSTDRGGYVTGFDGVFDAAAYDIAGVRLAGLDPVFRWLLHVVRSARVEAAPGEAALRRAGLVVGNLSYPTRSLDDLAAEIWAGGAGSHFENRFCSGLPAHLTASLLGLGGEALTLDAACASSIYALRIACDRLHAREADVMFAAATNHSDDLFLHVGFTALQALSPTGQSRPFHREADGLLPAHGAGCVALQRLADAEAEGRVIHGVIRGIGLSNDGRAGGFLAPDKGGQVRAMQAAYASAGIAPQSIDLVECHATGTVVGDGAEIGSMGQVFTGMADLPVGSLKSNMGHLITVAGLAGLLKLTGAMASGIKPPTLHADRPLDAFAGTPFRPLSEAEDWQRRDGPRRAGLSAFGFGGNNAHLIIEEWEPRPSGSVAVAGIPRSPAGAIAVTGIGMVTGAGRGMDAFARRLFGDDAGDTVRVETAKLPIKGLRYPPKDMKVALGQQSLIMEAAFQVAGSLDGIAPGRIGCLVGMGCDPEIARYALRLRNDAWRRQIDGTGNGEDCAPLEAAGVIGSMPNIPANRLSSQFDWRAFGYTVSAEELSGIAALRLAARALEDGDADAVIVGAVETPGDRVHEAACAALSDGGKSTPGDAAVVMVLRRPDDIPEGVRSLALIDTGGDGQDADSVTVSGGRFGDTHAASGLLEVAAAIAIAAHGRERGADGFRTSFRPDGPPALQIGLTAITGRVDSVVVRPGRERRGYGVSVPEAGFWRGQSLDELANNLASGSNGGEGEYRLAIVAPDRGLFTGRCKQAAEMLRSGKPADGEGVSFGHGPAGGELAFVFPGAAAAYAGMGRRFFEAFPNIAGELARRHPVTGIVAADLYDAGRAREQFDQLKGCALVCQGHAIAAREVLGLNPAAVIGLSSGETNGLYAMGVWRDMDAMFEEIDASGMYGRYLTGDFESARQSWDLPDGQQVTWVAWRVLAPVLAVRAAAETEARAAITIVNTPEDCVVAGEEAAVRRVVQSLAGARVIDLGHPMVVHCPEMSPYEDTWRRIHTRRTHAPDGVRFYSNHTGRAYRPTRKNVADRLTGQALECIDFPRTVEQAYADGVRCFLELGPRDTSTQAIRAILGDRPCDVMAFDTASRDGIGGVVSAAVRLFASGHLEDPSRLASHLGRMTGREKPESSERMLELPLHRSPVVLPQTGERPVIAVEPDRQVMARPPQLPALSGLEWRPVAVDMPPQRPAAVVPESAAPSMQNPADIVAEVHREYIALQTASYNEFLAMQMRLGTAAPAAGNLALAVAAPLPEGPEVRTDIAPVLREAVVPEPARAPDRKPEILFDRVQLETLASGRVSDVLGPLFRQQDDYDIQVRLPEPPLLLVDRVTALDGEAGGMGTGFIETETDVDGDEWYMHRGAMTPGAIIESGQADLLLISWLGVDFLNRGKRAYRLLGCELTFHGGGLPKPGDTLTYGIHVDGHAKTGDVRLFFFHYDCRIGDRLLLSVRDGQAGFFTPDELANSGGVLWDAADDAPLEDFRLDRPYPVTGKRSFSEADITAFLDGDALTCFGPGFEESAPHQRTPAPPGGRMRMIDCVPEFDPDGGPWGRGYLRAETRVAADHWFYSGHFLNDPCMPGTLMADAALQALAIAMTAYGYTLHRDSWRFEPAPGEAFKFVCRGQVTPDRDHLLTYEVFIEDIRDGEFPEIRAALLCRSDGFKVFQCRRFALRLVPDWPYRVERPEAEARMVGTDASVPGDHAALIACAWGAPSSAFGEMYRRFDSAHRVPRLPGEPYHFISDIRSVDCPSGRPTVNGGLIAEYRVPQEAWYFVENGSPVMPYGVLMEVLLQPCGWLGSYMGFALADIELAIRNLDGDGAIVHRAVTPGSGLIETRTRLTRFSKVGVLNIVFFRVEATLDGEPLMEMNTSFGFFTDEALANQAGLPASAEVRQRLDDPSDVALDLDRDELPGRVPVAAGMYRMIDGITGFWPAGGAAGLGRIRGRQAVDPRAWYFKAHFFQDPVQPGSLGIEALVQLLQCHCRLAGLDDGFADPAFEPFAFGEALVWKYRGQVRVRNREVRSDLDITRIERDGAGVLVTARGSLWVDGMRIYEVDNLAVRIVESSVLIGEGTGSGDVVLDSASSPWIADHCPTHTRPALPFMVLADLVAGSVPKAPGEKIVAIEDMRVYRWALVDPSIRLRPTLSRSGDVWKVVLAEITDTAGEKTIAEAMVRVAETWPEGPGALPPLGNGEIQPDPYEKGCLFHGPSFRILSALRRSSDGASFTLDPAGGAAPYGAIHPCLLDGMMHGVPHDALEQWFPDIAANGLAYPVHAECIRFHAPMPANGDVRVEIRPASGGGRAVIEGQLIAGGQVICEMRIREEILPQGPLGSAAPEDRKAFLGRREAVPGMRLSASHDGVTSLDGAAVMASNWLPGTVETVYDVTGDMRSLIREIAIKEHVAAHLGVHPSEIVVDGTRASHAGRSFAIVEEWSGNRVTIRDD
ncbi:MAG: beta-ketoacyl synthase N-terminal-like domain-containing protein [Rhodospirillales bacterium]